MEITEEQIKKLVRMEATMMFIELQDQFGMYARYYDPTSLELLDEKIEVMRQMKEGVPFELIPDSKDILEGLVKIGPDGRIVERGDVGSKLDLLAKLLEERYSERCVSSPVANPFPRWCTEASHTTATAARSRKAIEPKRSARTLSPSCRLVFIPIWVAIHRPTILDYMINTEMNEITLAVQVCRVCETITFHNLKPMT